MRRILYGYFRFDDDQEGPSPWHDAVYAGVLAREGTEHPVTLTLAEREIAGVLILQEVEDSLWPEHPDDKASPPQRAMNHQHDDLDETELPF